MGCQAHVYARSALMDDMKSMPTSGVRSKSWPQTLHGYG